MGANWAAHRAAVIGSPVAHSLSPVLHHAAYRSLGLTNWEYESIEVLPGDLTNLLRDIASPIGGEPVWEGLSVTMPHKQTVTRLLDVVDPLATAVGVVNTVVAQRSGAGSALLAGFNTDVEGIVEALKEAGGSRGADCPRAPRALVLGSGATASSALAALGEMKAGSILVAARTHAGPGRAQAAAHRMGLEIETMTWDPADIKSSAEVACEMTRRDVVISTLPAGAADTVASSLREVSPPSPDSPEPTVLDVVYAPWPTAFASAWEERGAHVAPGWLMLLYQAVPQVRLMTGHTPALEDMRCALLAELAARERA